MLGLILPLAFIAVAATFVYRTAKGNGYNAVMWTAAAVGAFIAIQIGTWMAIAIIFVVGMSLLGWDELTVSQSSFVLEWLGMVPSIVAVMLILRHVNRMRDDFDAPPPPTHFNLNA